MPDGSIQHREGIHTAMTAMHVRLVQWGLIMLKASSPMPEEEEEQGKHKAWTGVQQDEAMNLHRLVIRLPAQHRIVLQVFYAQNIASDWFHARVHPLWWKIEKELTVEVNQRLRTLAREIGQPAEPIGHWQFRLIRERATRMLMSNDLLMAEISKRERISQ